jgi:hypothetical protein
MTDILVIRTTGRGALTADVLPDAAPNWKSHYPKTIVSMELAPGEAAVIPLDEIITELHGVASHLDAVVKAWRARRTA